MDDLPVYKPKPGEKDIQQPFIKHFIYMVKTTNLTHELISNKLSVPYSVVKEWIEEGKTIYNKFVPLKSLSIPEKRLHEFYSELIAAESDRVNELTKDLQINSKKDLKSLIETFAPTYFSNSNQKSESSFLDSLNNMSDEEVIELLLKNK